MWRTLSRLSVLGLLAYALACPEHCWAESMDPELSRLRLPPGKAGCPSSGGFCPNDEAFERLVSDLSVAMSPAVGSGAAGLGSRGFSLRLASSVTPISGKHWVLGSAGANAASESFNASPDGSLVWNRLEIHKGLPFGFEFGGSLGHGIDTSLWSFSGEVRLALFEGFRSGLGALPDVALRGAYQVMLGSREMSLRTIAFDVTLSKPYVIAGRHQLTPLLAMQALFSSASGKPIDLTPDTSAFDGCAPQVSPADGATSIEPGRVCSNAAGARDLASTVRFADVQQTRIRLFLGLEERYGPFTGAFTFGFDLVVPERSANTPGDGIDGALARSVTLHFVLGLRY
jgi:hypothetical protein